MVVNDRTDSLQAVNSTLVYCYKCGNIGVAFNLLTPLHRRSCARVPLYRIPHEKIQTSEIISSEFLDKVQLYWRCLMMRCTVMFVKKLGIAESKIWPPYSPDLTPKDFPLRIPETAGVCDSSTNNAGTFRTH
ncbi:hypothetical protein TNCV_2332051 [Trichonephila clavipes]|nr:hypothetical protein TNCV_2332051 [Trichonephila clavipes]